MKKTTPLMFLLAVLLGLPAFGQDAPTANLRPQWVVGQTARYDFWSKMEKNETAELFGQTQSETTVYVTEGRVEWVVEEVNDDGSTACTMRMLTIKYTITSGENEPIVIDSENPAGDEQMKLLEDLLSAMVSSPITVRVNADGTIASVEGIDELEAAAGQDAIDAEVIPEELDFVESASELATLLSAPAQATAGQTWNVKNTWNQDSVMPGTPAKADWDTTFTLSSIGQIEGVPIATVKADSSIDIKVDLSELPANAPDIDIQINDARGQAEILFDLSRHETVARHDSMSYRADITITPPNDEIPPVKVTITETTQSQLLRVEQE